MRERAMMFGTQGDLVGILTEARSDESGTSDVGVIFLNSGILHRVGANRLHVTLARRLAERGFSGFRFDHAGIGDSGSRKDDRPFRESAIAEVREAMDVLQETRGLSRFVLAGLCSGSDMGYWTSLEDDRVTGLIQLDPFVYRTRRFLLRYYGPRLVSPGAWWRSATARIRSARSAWKDRRGEGGMDPDWAMPEYTRVFPPRAEVAAGLGELCGRDVRFFVFISGAMRSIVNHAEQYERSFPEVEFGDRLTVQFRPGTDHMVSGLEAREELVHDIAMWMVRHWGSGVSEASASADAAWKGAEALAPSGGDR